ncbi:hypothetical protein BGZ46_001753 [Entomortierella lignicola]|nr:hypothetical protein BGZ46_001753 [Entomortierella lignicola]
MKKNWRHIRELHMGYYWALETILKITGGQEEAMGGSNDPEIRWNLQRLSILIDSPPMDPIPNQLNHDLLNTASALSTSTSDTSMLYIRPLVKLLGLCPHLTSIELDFNLWGPIYISNESYQLIANALSTHCLSLNELELRCNEANNDENVACLINASTSGWRKLKFEEGVIFGPLSSTSLVQHASTLTSLDVIYCGGFASRDIQFLLSNASQLKRFWTSTEGEMIEHSDAELNATDIEQSEWICTSLEIFGVVINGIPRPDIMTHQDGSPFIRKAPDMTREKGRALQLTVYRHLGSLTALRELRLGHGERDWGNENKFWVDEDEQTVYDVNQYECLEMTLDTGLDMLSELKQLEVLDVTLMSHRIGIKEVQWMSENWPKLKKVSGLIYFDEPMPKCATWLQENRPDIEVPLC